MPAGTHRKVRKKAKRRIDWVATHRMIGRFLERDVTEFRVKRRAKRLVTTPEEIAEHTGLDVKTVRKWLSRAAKKRVEGKVVVIRVSARQMWSSGWSVAPRARSLAPPTRRPRCHDFRFSPTFLNHLLLFFVGPKSSLPLGGRKDLEFFDIFSRNMSTNGKKMGYLSGVFWYFSGVFRYF